MVLETEATKKLLFGISSDAIVGVVATLLGTILGWFLSVIQNYGRLVVYIKSWEESYVRGAGVFDERTEDIRDAKRYIFDLEIEVYNNSHVPKIARDICVVFTKKKRFHKNKLLLRCTPNDQATAHHAGGGTQYNKVAAKNVAPNEIITLTLHHGFIQEDNPFTFREQANRVYLEYKDAKNHINRILIKKLA